MSFPIKKCALFCSFVIMSVVLLSCNKVNSPVTTDTVDSLAITLEPSQWIHSSIPVNADDPQLQGMDKLNYKGKLFWYKYFIPRVPIVEVYPNRTTIQGTTTLLPLEINFNPYIRGIYNRNAQFVDNLNPHFSADSINYTNWIDANKPKIWAGMTHVLPANNRNFELNGYNYFDIMMKLDQWDPGSKMYVEFGTISEDIIPNQILDAEKGITVAQDIGIDGINDSIEKIAGDPRGYPYPLNLESDPARDNFYFDFAKNDDKRTELDFVRYNNFEGNSVHEWGKTPDSEILDRNNSTELNLENSYYGYEVILSPYPDTNQQIIGGGSNGWYLYRLKLRNPSYIVGNPQLSNIKYVRVWFKGGRVKSQIQEWKFVK